MNFTLCTVIKITVCAAVMELLQSVCDTFSERNNMLSKVRTLSSYFKWLN